MFEFAMQYAQSLAMRNALAPAAKKTFTAAQLAASLVLAEAAHGAAVKAGKATDADWPQWYADYIVNGGTL
jgi:hypothetical protein